MKKTTESLQKALIIYQKFRF